jgi:hypothetical protein
MDILSQKTMPWGNELLGASKYYIHAYGSTLTVLAEILGLTPSEVNEKLKALGGFGPGGLEGELYEIIWEKIVPAFPGWSAQFIAPYNNEAVVDAIAKGRSVIVLVDGAPIGLVGTQHAVRYIGNAMCHDPFTGTERPTSDFPDVKAFIVLTHTPVPAEEPVEVENPAPVEATGISGGTVDTTGTPTAPVDITLANLPMHEKTAIVAQLEKATEEIKKLLAL